MVLPLVKWEAVCRATSNKKEIVQLSYNTATQSVAVLRMVCSYYMKQNKEIVVGSGVAVVLVGVIIWVVLANIATQRQSAVPTSLTIASSTAPVVSTTTLIATPVVAHTPATYRAPAKTAPRSYMSALTVDSRDTITSWDTHVQATPAIKNRLREEILTLSGSIGSTQKKNYNTFLQIAQDYWLLSDGKNAYNFYVLSAQAVPSNGLAWSNVGSLMERIGAYHTARSAYAASVAISPKTEQFWVSYLDFLSAHEPLASSTGPAFVAAARATNSAPNVLISMANWEASIGNFSVAIADWRLVRAKVGVAQQKAVDTKIKSLQKQQ